MKTILVLALSFLVLLCKENNLENKNKQTDENLKKIIFFGDSLTAGLGLENPKNAYPYLVIERLKQEGIELKLINAGLSGDTTSGGLSRIDWVLSNGVDYFILELGANDGMRGIQTEVIEKNLKKIISKVREKNPSVKILLVKMLTFPNLGPVYVKKFEAVFPKIAKSESVSISPFLLEKVAGIKKYNQKDGIHPTEEGHKLLADTIYPSIKKLVSPK